jgi:hypothetical protein
MTPEQIKKWREQAYAIAFRAAPTITPSGSEWLMRYETEFARLVRNAALDEAIDVCEDEVSIRKKQRLPTSGLFMARNCIEALKSRTS